MKERKNEKKLVILFQFLFQRLEKTPHQVCDLSESKALRICPLIRLDNFGKIDLKNRSLFCGLYIERGRRKNNPMLLFELFLTDGGRESVFTVFTVRLVSLWQWKHLSINLNLRGNLDKVRMQLLMHSGKFCISPVKSNNYSFRALSKFSASDPRFRVNFWSDKVSSISMKFCIQGQVFRKIIPCFNWCPTAVIEYSA